MKKVNILIFLLCLAITGFGQNMKMAMADDYYAAYQYSKAAPIYEELAYKSLKGKGKLTEGQLILIIRRAAQSNFLQHNYKNAEFWYAKLINQQGGSIDDQISYLKLLQINGKYTEVASFSKRFNSENPGNYFIKQLADNGNYLNDLKADSFRFKIEPVSFNSEYPEFCPVIVEGGMVFAGQMKSKGTIEDRFEWDDTYFMDLYYVDVQRDGTIGSKPKTFERKFESTLHDGPVAFNKDMSKAFITRNNMLPGRKKEKDVKRLVNVKLFTAEKLPTGEWSKPIEFKYNSNKYSTGQACLSPDGNVLYFVSDMPGGFGETDIWKSELVNGSWGAPINLGPKINTPGKEMFPYVAANSKLYFSSDGHLGMGGLDLFVAYDESGSLVIENLGYPANSSFDDFGISLRDNSLSGYISSNRPIGKDNSDNIYAIEIKETIFNLQIAVVLDDEKKTPAANATVKVLNNTTGKEETYTSDASGRVNLKLKKASAYTVMAKKVYHESVGFETVSTIGKKQSEDFEVEMKLKKQLITFSGLVLDKQFQKPITNTTVSFVNPLTNESQTFTTDDKGMFVSKVDPEELYRLSLEKEGFYPEVDSLSTKGMVPPSSFKKTFILKKIPKVNDSFVLNNIYYDYGKYSLRDESKQSLDELYDYLVENPNVMIELSSHTDSRSSYSYNQTLSQRRAQSCVDYIVSKGISRKRIIAKGYSWSRLTNECKPGVECSEEEHQANRRTEIRILKVN